MKSVLRLGHWIVLLGVFAAAGEIGAAMHQPNVLFFALDDMNDWVGALGHQQAITPNMDRLARSGVNFVNAHTAGVRSGDDAHQDPRARCLEVGLATWKANLFLLRIGRPEFS